MITDHVYMEKEDHTGCITCGTMNHLTHQYQGAFAPRPHLNGTSRETLLEEYCAQITAVSEALRTMRENGPNQRDYYHMQNRAWVMAVDQHRSRLARLESVLRELTAIAEEVANG